MAETTITHAAPFARYSLRARTPQALEQVTGLKLPRKINNARGDVICLGPDEWLALLPDGAKLNMGDGLPVSIADISYRQIGIVIEGPRAVELIAAGCPLDVARIPVGYATRTIFELVEIILWRQAETRIHIEVWRSFAPWLCEALQRSSVD